MVVQEEQEQEQEVQEEEVVQQEVVVVEEGVQEEQEQEEVWVVGIGSEQRCIYSRVEGQYETMQVEQRKLGCRQSGQISK